MKLQNMKRGETTEQITLFNWAENNKHILPCLSLMYHIPNEGKRTNGAVLKAIEAKHMKGITIDVGQGVKAKVSKMAKESIKVERSETSKKIYEE